MGVDKISDGHWRVDWRDSHGKRCRKVIEGSKRKAELYLAERLAERETRQDNPRALLNVTVSRILEIYMLERRAGKGSEKASRSHVAWINGKWAETKLEYLDRMPHVLIEWFANVLTKQSPKQNPSKRLSPKTIWNIRATFRAALTHFIRTRRLRIPNPMEVVEMPKETATRHQCPDYAEFQIILMEAQKPAYHPQLWKLFVAGWESGQRINEILSWKWEDIVLEVKGDELPWLRQKVSKQRSLTLIELPMSQDLWAMLKGMPGPKEQGIIWSWPSAPHKAIRKALNGAGFPGYRFHDFRRSLNTRMKEKGFSRELTGRYQVHSMEMDKAYDITGRRQLEQMVRDTWECVQNVSNMDTFNNESDGNNDD